MAARLSVGKVASLIAAASALAVLAGCASTQPKAMVNKRSKEYFAESEYGVKASPRVTTKRSRLPRGGGRDQIGKPYMVKGKMYYPKEDPNYRKVGSASWYGDAFHGRLTANGEIYDMTHLTAAHPTMPLPSYARVTNLANGSSVVVRVNDRGPYAHGRLIDLSKRAAEMLDYAQVGIAKVQVQYLGRAPLHGQDDQYLLASYNPGNGHRGPAPAPDEIAPGVMIAMAGPTPTASLGAPAVPFPGQAQNIVDAGDPVLPAYGPIPPERPLIDLVITTAPTGKTLRLSYADERVARASQAFAALSGDMSAEEVLQSWKRQHPNSPEYIAVGTFASRGEAERQVRNISEWGRAELQATETGDATWYLVNLYEDGRYALDDMLERAWAIGASDAIVVRD